MPRSIEMRLVLLLASLSALVMVACGSDSPSLDEGQPELASPPTADTTPVVVTTIEPVDWLVRQLVADQARVERWSRPSVEQIVSLDTPAVDLLIAHGAGVESWMQTATLPERKIVFASQDLDLMQLEGPTHSHGSEGEHSHRAPDPSTWADPRLMIVESRHIAEVLSTLLPASAAQIDQRRASLEARLQDAATAYEDAWRAALDAGGRFAQTERAFGYVARAVDIDLLTVELDPQVAPSSATVERISEWIQQLSPTSALTPVLLWTGKPEPAVVEGLPSSLHHLTLDGLDRSVANGEYDYLEQLSGNVDRLDALVGRLRSRS